MATPPVPQGPTLRDLRDLTPARVGLGRTGAGLPTEALLAFTLDHAEPFVISRSADEHSTIVQVAIRHGDLKLVHATQDKAPPQLFDLAKDVGEKTDLAQARGEDVRALKALWDRWNAEQAPPAQPEAPEKP